MSGITKVVREKLSPPEEFPFPFSAYGIQKDFMRELYGTLEDGKIGLFESPTGTGKSMSLICGALKWLKDSDERDKNEADKILTGQHRCLTSCKQEKNNNQKDTEPDWMKDYEEKQVAKEMATKLKEAAERKLRRQERAKKLKEQYGPLAKHWIKKKLPAGSDDKATVEQKLVGSHDDDDDDIVLAEYDSDPTVTKGSCDTEESLDDEEPAEDHVRKVFYCSRTHSQLAQFVHEVQRSPYAASMQVVSMGSRQNMCINDDVRRLKSVQLINDKCLELQKKSGKKENSKIKNTNDGKPPSAKRPRGKRTAGGGCPFYKPTVLGSFSDLALDEVRDIEQLVSMGRELKACPYYGTRYSLPSAQLVVLPYQVLLHAATRQAVGINLQGNVIIIDEAHNLLDTISSIHSVYVTGAQVQTAHSQLTQYVEKYKVRLKAKNVMYIRQLLFILNCFIKCMTVQKAPNSNAGATAETKLMKLNDFLFESHMDNVNLFKLIQYCQRSEISRKLNGFVDRYQSDLISHAASDVTDDHQISDGSHVVISSPLMIIESFLTALTNADQDGRIVITKKKGQLSQSFIKFLLLNPGVYFTDIVSESRAVIMVGGTMQPVAEFRDQLLATAGVAADCVLEFSCGHVIPSNHLLAISLASGPSGQALDFTYESRDSTIQVDELARVITNLCAIVPGGIVCFFPSYDYENMVCTKWESTGVMDKIRKKKQVFREPRSSGAVDDVLTNYTRCIKACSSNQPSVGVAATTGAILMCVVSGKMSEGINFSDDLGRCVVIVGLPYPNIKSPELAEKMQYLNTTMPKCANGRLPGQVHYENLCMKAVNQSIGRAIRHSGDYASILLLDQRYLRPSITSKLPTWISQSLQTCDKFGLAFSALRKFYVSKKSIT